MNTDNWRTAAADLVKDRIDTFNFEARGRLVLALAEVADEAFVDMMNAAYACHCYKPNPKPNDYLGPIVVMKASGASNPEEGV